MTSESFNFVDEDWIMVDNVIIYYFSGTGNSKNVASWLHEVATQMGIACRVFNIAAMERQFDNYPANALIIIVSPVHGFNYPPLVLNFIARFPKGHNRVFLMCTRAGMRIGKYNLPGLSGLTFYLSSLILMLKGYKIKGMIPVDLPSNWVSIHPGLNRPTVDFLYQRNHTKIKTLAPRILSEKGVWKGLRDIVQDTLVMPISLGYYFIGRFLFAKSFYASRDCNDCDLCLQACPAKAIIKVNNRPFWTFRCESCMKCITNCPKKAIETAHGFIIGYLFLASMITGLMFYYFERYIIQIESGFLKWIADSAITILLLGVAYRIIHYLMRFTVIERLMVFTSLTRFRFWGKERARYYDQAQRLKAEGKSGV